MDADLRPEGKQGPLARSVDGYRTYFERWAQPWERLAMTRARPVAGDLELGRRLIDALRPLVWRDGLSDDDRREIRRIKARVERERIPAERGPAVPPQARPRLAVRRRVHRPAAAAAARHRVAGHDGRARQAGGRAGVLDRTRPRRPRRRLPLLRADPQPPVPVDRCARATRCPSRASGSIGWPESLGMTATELRDDYRRRTRRAREVVERLFYGRDPLGGDAGRTPAQDEDVAVVDHDVEVVATPQNEVERRVASGLPAGRQPAATATHSTRVRIRKRRQAVGAPRQRGERIREHVDLSPVGQVRDQERIGGHDGVVRDHRQPLGALLVASRRMRTIAIARSPSVTGSTRCWSPRQRPARRPATWPRCRRPPVRAHAHGAPAGPRRAPRRWPPPRSGRRCSGT